MLGFFLSSQYNRDLQVLKDPRRDLVVENCDSLQMLGLCKFLVPSTAEAPGLKVVQKRVDQAKHPELSETSRCCGSGVVQRLTRLIMNEF